MAWSGALEKETLSDIIFWNRNYGTSPGICICAKACFNSSTLGLFMTCILPGVGKSMKGGMMSGTGSDASGSNLMSKLHTPSAVACGFWVNFGLGNCL